MRQFRFLLVAFALMLSTSTFANTTSAFDAKRESVSAEIEKMLRDSNLVIEKDFTVRVIFTVTEDKRIEIQKISSPDEKVNDFLMKRLENQKLNGSSWQSNKIYELPVKVQAKR